MKKFKMMLASCILLGIGSLLVQKFDKPNSQDFNENPAHGTTEIVKPVQAKDSVKKETKPQNQKTGYKIQEYNGNIAVFEKGQNEPFRRTEIAVKNLPEADRKELKNGIEVTTNEELQALLEDYLS